jgi:Tfp pilus assembly protein PilV
MVAVAIMVLGVLAAVAFRTMANQHHRSEDQMILMRKAK